MASNEEVLSVMSRFYDTMANPLIHKIEKTNIGIGMVLKYLEKAAKPVSAGEISKNINVSTARVAVLLHTMTDKGLIVIKPHATDARKILVSLSDEGKAHIAKVRAETIALMSEIIDNVGLDRMNEFIEISSQIKATVAKKMQAQQQ